MFNLTTTHAGINRWIENLDRSAESALQSGQLNNFEKTTLNTMWSGLKDQYECLAEDGLTREESVTLMNALNNMNRVLGVSRNQNITSQEQLDREVGRIFGDSAEDNEATPGLGRRQNGVLMQLERGRQSGKLSSAETDILTRLNDQYNDLYEQLSSDQDGGLTQEDKAQLNEKLTDIRNAIQIANAFDITDTNQDGVVNEADLRAKMDSVYDLENRPADLEKNAPGMTGKLNNIDIRTNLAGDKLNDDEKAELGKQRTAFNTLYEQLLNNDDDGDGKADKRLTEREREQLHEKLDKLSSSLRFFVQGDWQEGQTIQPQQ